MATTQPIAMHRPPPPKSGALAPKPPVTRDTHNSQSLGRELNAHVKQARVLMVGAGGIGCELLKNLALCGFGEIHAVDLDTIDLSNLNRQFLFRQEHIKKSKALVAKEAAEKFNPNIKIIAHHADIKASQFSLEWFMQFNVVFNALDNIAARRYVNTMCLAANVPLIESGTTGFKGQVQVIRKGVTACYDCAEKEIPKSFPVCTIRSTPSQPIHCIVWAKSYLLNEVFGTSEDQSVLDHTQDQSNAEEISELRREAEALRAIRESMGTDSFAQMLFNKVFKSDIERLRSMEEMWKDRSLPDALDYETLAKKAAGVLESEKTNDILRGAQRVWSLEENFAVFLDSLKRLSNRMLEMKKNSAEATIEFDKDDQDTLDFVVASANIRSVIFGIEYESHFDIKQMAGNIIPAIATTNAIVAGLCVLEAFKVLKSQFDAAKEVFLTPGVPERRMASNAPMIPHPECLACGVFYTSAAVDLTRATLQDFVDEIVKGVLGFEDDREFSLTDISGTNIYYDPDLEDNLPKTLANFGVQPGSFLAVKDESEEPLVDIRVYIQEPQPQDGASKPIQALYADKKLEIAKKPKKALAPELESNGVVETNGTTQPTAQQTGKRARADSEEPSSSRDPKKAKLFGASNKDLVVVDDEAAGIVILDD